MPITLRTVRGVVVDGSTPINFAPTVQILHLARGTDGIVRATIVDSVGLPVDLTNCAVTLSIKQYPDDPSPLIARLGDVLAPYAAGVVEFAIGANDTITIGEGTFVYDVVVVFGDATRAQVVPISNFVVDASANSSTLLPTIPIPALENGKVLGNDGTNLEWVDAGAGGGLQPGGIVASDTNKVIQALTSGASATLPVTVGDNGSQQIQLFAKDGNGLPIAQTPPGVPGGLLQLLGMDGAAADASHTAQLGGDLRDRPGSGGAGSAAHQNGAAGGHRTISGGPGGAKNGGGTPGSGGGLDLHGGPSGGAGAPHGDIAIGSDDNQTRRNKLGKTGGPSSAGVVNELFGSLWLAGVTVAFDGLAAVDIPSASQVSLGTSGDVDCTLTPAFNAPPDSPGDGSYRLIYLRSSNSGNTIKFHDESVLGGSGFLLQAPTRELKDNAVLVLLYVGSVWLEVGYRFNTSADVPLVDSSQVAPANALMTGEAAVEVSFPFSIVGPGTFTITVADGMQAHEVLVQKTIDGGPGDTLQVTTPTGGEGTEVMDLNVAQWTILRSQRFVGGGVVPAGQNITLTAVQATNVSCAGFVRCTRHT